MALSIFSIASYNRFEVIVVLLRKSSFEYQYENQLNHKSKNEMVLLTVLT